MWKYVTSVAMHVFLIINSVVKQLIINRKKFKKKTYHYNFV